MSGINSRYIDGSYLEDTEDWHEGDALWKAVRIIKMIERIAPSPKSICDVGCGSGGVLFQIQKLIESPAKLTGFDISPQATKIANKRASKNLEYKNQNIFDQKDLTFDLLMLIDVFEHVEDYLGFLMKIRNYSKYFIFHIPLDLSALSVIREWPLLRRRSAVGHLHYFTKATAIETLKDCGFEVLHDFYTPSGFQPPDNSIKASIRDFPKKVLYRCNPDYAVRTLGGYSLMVLAKAIEE